MQDYLQLDFDVTRESTQFKTVLIIARVQQKWIFANHLKTIADFVLLCYIQADIYA
jgi:hypothetical protein